MTVVLDTSASIELVLKRGFSSEIRKVITGCSKIITSELYKAETTNVFWKYVKAELMTKADAITYLEFTRNIIDEYYDISPFQIEALNDGVKLKHPTDDLLFLLLAKRTGASLLTMDKKLRNLALSEGVDCPLYIIINQKNSIKIVRSKYYNALLQPSISLLFKKLGLARSQSCILAIKEFIKHYIKDKNTEKLNSIFLKASNIVDIQKVGLETLRKATKITRGEIGWVD